MAGVSSNPAPAWSNKYDAALTKEIINGQHILHVSFLTQDAEYPTVCYLVGKILKYRDDPEALYVHGHVQEPVMGRFVGREESDPDLHVSVVASTINSLYFGFSGFATGYAFASTVLNGTASLMDVSPGNHDEREWVMTQLINSQIPDHWRHLRPIGTDVDYVSIIKITPNALQSHTHSVLKVLGLEVLEDVKDKKLCEEHWEGAIPVWEKLGQPISGKNNLPEGKERVAPDYVHKFIAEENTRRKKLAKEIASADYPYDNPGHHYGP
ncbi:hypothetical protein SBOR_2138 [Sclerotinia borealis F-4128]|uniref:Flavin-nucleotide-binding protein n=1 Tax=Sclerotinia borealis (strain F-4128) TaxID=1432307 RepID=W9CS93_SCLBF|nr:hypothetical protein SBOR_2138 [Sclerotinia borealis F-4128]